MRTIKQLTYYYIFRVIIKLDRYLERFTKESNYLGSTGINYTICPKGKKFHNACACGSDNGRCL